MPRAPKEVRPWPCFAGSYSCCCCCFCYSVVAVFTTTAFVAGRVRFVIAMDVSCWVWIAATMWLSITEMYGRDHVAVVVWLRTGAVSGPRYNEFGRPKVSALPARADSSVNKKNKKEKQKQLKNCYIYLCITEITVNDKTLQEGSKNVRKFEKW